MRIPLRARVIGAATAVAASLSVLTGLPATAATLQYWYGTVTKVADGDTIYVDISGDGKSAVPIRNTNIQATETVGGPGGGAECHATEAKNRMAQLLPVGTKVRVAAYSASSTAGTDGAGATRLLRYVDKYNSANGQYDVDIQRELLKGGFVLAGAEATENARYQQYAVDMQKAMTARLEMFNTNKCGGGPAAGARLPMWIHYDANGADGAAPNTEWMRIQNLSTFDVSLSGWKLRDRGHTWYKGSTYYTFPSYTVIPAGQFITVYPGSGTNNASTGKYYLGVTQGAFFGNVTNPALADPGKQMYLLDPQLDFRGWAVYPCLDSCSKPPVHISYVRYSTSDEYIDITTDSGVSAAVDLSGLEVTNDGWTKELRPGTIINPGEVLRVYCERPGTDIRLQQYWNHTGGTMLEDGGDTVVLRTARSVVLTTYKWGSG